MVTNSKNFPYICTRCDSVSSFSPCKSPLLAILSIALSGIISCLFSLPAGSASGATSEISTAQHSELVARGGVSAPMGTAEFCTKCRPNLLCFR